MNPNDESLNIMPAKDRGKAIKLMVPEISDLLCMNIRFLITGISQIRVIIAFSDPKRLPKLLDFEYDCILLANYKWVTGYGLQETANLIAEHPHVKMLVYFLPHEVDKAGSLYRMGIHGFFSDEVTKTEFQQGLISLARGENFYSQDIIRRLVSADNEPGGNGRKPVRVTPLEQRLFSMILKGQANEEIAMKLSMTMGAVERSRKRLNQKFRINDCVELIRPVEPATEFVPYELELPHEPGANAEKYTVFLR